MAAFTIVSETNKTISTLKNLYEFLGDFKNFKLVLPDDKVTNFQYDGDLCSFEIKGITPMKIKLQEKHAYDFILFITEGLAKFDFTLKAHFIGDPEQPGECRIDLGGDLNPFIKSMAEKSLLGLINTMSLKLSQLNLDNK